MENGERLVSQWNHRGKSGDERSAAVLLDPHPLWLNAVEQVIHGLGMGVVASATTSSEALTLIEQHQPELFVTEVELRHDPLDGVACIARARERIPSMKVVVLSALDEPGGISAALAAGASAYVLKSARPEDFASAVRQAFEPSVYLASAPPEEAGLPVLLRAANTAGLTNRELEILRLASDGRSNAELARMLWVSEQTVKFHLSNIYRKLDVSNRTEASRWAQLHGLLSATATAQTATVG